MREVPGAIELVYRHPMSPEQARAVSQYLSAWELTQEDIFLNEESPTDHERSLLQIAASTKAELASAAIGWQLSLYGSWEPENCFGETPEETLAQIIPTDEMIPEAAKLEFGLAVAAAFAGLFDVARQHVDNAAREAGWPRM